MEHARIGQRRPIKFVGRLGCAVTGGTHQSKSTNLIRVSLSVADGASRRDRSESRVLQNKKESLKRMARKPYHHTGRDLLFLTRPKGPVASTPVVMDSAINFLSSPLRLALMQKDLSA